MSSMSNVAGLSKYITTLPKVEKTSLVILIISFIVGIVYFLISPIYHVSIFNSIIFGGFYGICLLGISTILSGFIQMLGIKIFKGMNVKIKHSMFLSFLSMIIISLVIIIGAISTSVFKTDYLINSILFGCILILGMNTLIFRSSSRISYKKSVLLGIIQPTFIIISFMILFFLNNHYMLFLNEIFSFLIKIIIGSIIIILGIYAFVKAIEAPMKKNLNINIFDVLSHFIKHMNEGSDSLESVFNSMGEEIETIVTFVCFKNNKGMKSLFISPCVHPGPLGEIGGSNMPTILANKFDTFTMVAHGPSTHDFNPVSVKEIDKIENAIKKGLKNVSYSNKASKFRKYKHGKSKIGIQYFNKGMIILSNFAPEASDDIEFAVGLTMMTQSKIKCNINDSVIVDCHNSFTPESGGVLPGNPEVFELINLINNIKNDEEMYDSIKVGTSFNKMKSLTTNEGVGESGVKIMIIEVAKQRTAYVLFDSNNMEKGFRLEIIESVQDLNIDEIEIMTTDTHYVNTISRGYNPIGLHNKKEIIEYVRKGIKDALNDLEEVEVGTGTEVIKNLKTFGPNNSTEFISSISSTIAVSKIISPAIFISIILIDFIWIFYGSFIL